MFWSGKSAWNGEKSGWNGESGADVWCGMSKQIDWNLKIPFSKNHWPYIGSSLMAFLETEIFLQKGRRSCVSIADRHYVDSREGLRYPLGGMKVLRKLLDSITVFRKLLDTGQQQESSQEAAGQQESSQEAAGQQKSSEVLVATGQQGWSYE